MCAGNIVNKLQIHIKCKKIFRPEAEQFIILCHFNKKHQLGKKKTIDYFTGLKELGKVRLKGRTTYETLYVDVRKIYTDTKYIRVFCLNGNSKNFCSI